MSQPMELTLEQKFNIRSFETQVKQMSREQAQDFLVKLYEQMLTRENMYKEFIKHEWGIGPSPWTPKTQE
ncbi:NblA/ycf18 family protein [Spirulina sp. CS-785/01]|uniref:NblA/ycf18 family protein n=1 Tax=Spirulina sp. CS-785/01 TaxID=3021716 RepID=UPI00232C9239|nr:NblA/ycf18 family protein [Spirulina sp. CS-785/01]MDB9315440.1 NblA/ycf18 family protein [Spirulina sp. CS-785/01]